MIDDYKLFVQYTCTECNGKTMVEISVWDVSAYENECELCGTHGSIDIDMSKDKATCIHCGYQHLTEVSLNSW